MAASSAGNAWAVGTHFPGTTDPFSRTLILHWNGATWAHVASPNPGTSEGQLFAVTPASGGGAWAVGLFGNSPPNDAAQALAIHCC